MWTAIPPASLVSCPRIFSFLLWNQRISSLLLPSILRFSRRSMGVSATQSGYLRASNPVSAWRRRTRRCSLCSTATSSGSPPSAKNETSPQHPDAARPRDPGCAPGRVDSLRVCPCGLADCVRQRSRIDDGPRSGAAARACGPFGDRREPGQAHSPSADGSSCALVRGRPGGACDRASTGHGVCPPRSDRNPIHRQSASRSAYCSVCGSGFVPLRSDLRYLLRRCKNQDWPR